MKTILLVIATTLAGCSIAPPVDTTKLDYGSEPTIDYLKEGENIAKKGIYAYFPDSIMVRGLRHFERAWVRVDGEVRSGWRACYMVNMKDEFGQYTGWTTHYLLYKNNHYEHLASNREADKLCGFD